MIKLHPLAFLSLLLVNCTAPSGQQAPADGAESVADVFERVQSAVVTLRTESTAPVPGSQGLPVTTQGVGSGTLIDSEGRILTAAHVVQTAEEVQVEFFDGTVLPGEVISSDPLTDVALVQLVGAVPDGIAVARLGDSDAVRVGARVMVVGAPLGISHTLTVGHVSARRAAPPLLGGEGSIEVFQTDAAINPGNSGGPLMNLQGAVIGVVSYIASESGGNQGIGFAVSSRTVRERLLERPPMWSGMDHVLLTGRLAEVFHLPGGRPGLLIQRVAVGSPAERLGLRGGDVEITIAGETILIGGDVMLEVQGVTVSSFQDMDQVRSALAALGPEDVVSIKILRDGRRRTLKGKVADLE